MPAQAQGLLRGFDRVVGSSFFPRYLEPFAPERITQVDPPSSLLVKNPKVLKSELAVFKIRGNNSCGDGIEGSGFMYSPHRIMTNAHVVAGVTDPSVVVGTRSYKATVVYYDAKVDVAVLKVDEIDGPVVHFNQSGTSKDDAVVLGFPNDGPFNAQPAKIRDTQSLRSPDIYGRGTVIRDVFSLRALVRPGNSGGPLISAEPGSAGLVFGVIFAASVSNKETGYALTAGQVSTAAASGIENSQQTSTGGCA